MLGLSTEDQEAVISVEDELYVANGGRIVYLDSFVSLG